MKDGLGIIIFQTFLRSAALLHKKTHTRSTFAVFRKSADVEVRRDCVDGCQRMGEAAQGEKTIQVSKTSCNGTHLGTHIVGRLHLLKVRPVVLCHLLSLLVQLVRMHLQRLVAVGFLDLCGRRAAFDVQEVVQLVPIGQGQIKVGSTLG